jgi:HD superfamily phosphohydrolase
MAARRQRRWTQHHSAAHDPHIIALHETGASPAAVLHDIGHGPFSHTIEEVLKELKFLDSVVQKSDVDIAAIAEQMYAFHWRSLELAATIAFLEQHGDADNRRDAVKKAVDLKPACSGYADEAQEVLGTVGLQGFGGGTHAHVGAPHAKVACWRARPLPQPTAP